MITISKADEQLLLCIASGLPPVEWRNKCKTPDQLGHWDNVRQKYQCIYYELKSFFSGQESPILIEDKPDQLCKDYYIALADFYIALYACIRKAWRAIQQEADYQNIKIQDTPGEAIFQILIDDCRHEFSPCLQGYTEIRPRKIYNILIEKAKISNKIHEDENRNNKELARALNGNFLKKIVKFNPERLEATLYFYLEVIDQEAKKDENLATSYSYLEKINSNIEAFLSRLAYSRHAPPAYNWVNGVKKPCK